MALEIRLSRHASTQHFKDLFDYDHLPPYLREVSKPCAELAQAMIDRLPDGPELSAGLRKLREAKDCFVLQAVIEKKAMP
jgi:hypothetical protein